MKKHNFNLTKKDLKRLENVFYGIRFDRGKGLALDVLQLIYGEKQGEKVFKSNEIKKLQDNLYSELKTFVEQVLKEELSNSNNLVIDLEFNENKTRFTVLVADVDGEDYPDYNGYDFEDNVNELNDELTNALEDKLKQDKRFDGIDLNWVSISFEQDFENEKQQEQ